MKIKRHKKYNSADIKRMEYEYYVVGLPLEDIRKSYGVQGETIRRQLDENASYFGDSTKRLKVPEVTTWNFFNDNIEGI